MTPKRYFASIFLCVCALVHCKDLPAPTPTQVEPEISRGHIYVAGCPALHLDENGSFVLYSLCGMTLPDWDGRSGTYIRRDDGIVLSEEGRPQTMLSVEGDDVIWPGRFRMRPIGGVKPGVADKNGE